MKRLAALASPGDGVTEHMLLLLLLCVILQAGQR
jgi:hypothetical protein